MKDNALNELHTRDVGRHLVLLGPYSRDGWNHLGPAMYYLLALPYRLTGSNSVGMNVGALLINGLSIAGMAIIARRRGGLPLLLLTLVGSSLLVRTLGPDFLRDPWNPYIPVLPFGLVVFLTWEMICGQTWALPVAAFVATFCAQTHIGYVPLVYPLLAWGAVSLLVLNRRARRDQTTAGPGSHDLWRASLIAEAVLAVMWFPTFLAVVKNAPGNFTRVAHYFLHPQGHHTLGDGYRVVAAQFGLRPEWLTSAHAPNPYSGESDFLRSAPLPWLLIPFFLAAWVLYRRRLSSGYRLAVTVAVALALGVLSVWRTIGLVYSYRLRWTWVLAMATLLVVAWAVWTFVSDRAGPAQRRWLGALPVSALCVLAVVNTVSAARAGTPQRPESLALARVMPSVVAGLPPTRGDVIMRSAGDLGSADFRNGIFLWLERRGIAARVDGENDAQGFGSQRMHRGAPIRATLYVGSDDSFDKLAAQPDLRLIAYQGTHPPSERAPVAARLLALDAAHDAHTISDAEWVFKRIDLHKLLDHAVGVFIVNPAAGP